MAIFLRFAILAFLVLTIIRLVQRALGKRSSGRTRPGERWTNDHHQALDPYDVLGVDPQASQTEIKQAYRKALAEYHPDKTSHLGKDLQKLAQQKTQQIVEAYNQLI